MADPSTYSTSIIIFLSALIAMLTIYPILFPTKNQPSWLPKLWIALSFIVGAISVAIYLFGLWYFFAH
jgi:Ca2+/H+ antiporter